MLFKWLNADTVELEGFSETVLVVDAEGSGDVDSEDEPDFSRVGKRLTRPRDRLQQVPAPMAIRGLLNGPGSFGFTSELSALRRSCCCWRLGNESPDLRRRRPRWQPPLLLRQLLPRQLHCFPRQLLRLHNRDLRPLQHFVCVCDPCPRQR